MAGLVKLVPNLEILATDFAEYTRAAGELQKVQLEGLSREERMAFFINIYNALIVHGLVQFGTAENWIKRCAYGKAYGRLFGKYLNEEST